MTVEQIAAMLETRAHFKSVIAAIDEFARVFADLNKEDILPYLGKEKDHFSKRLEYLDKALSIDGEVVNYEEAMQ